MTTSLENALLSLQGLSVGDGFGEKFFAPSTQQLIVERRLPPRPWPWTDDTHMALSIVEMLAEYGRIDQDALATAFARRYTKQPYRGYGGGAARLLARVSRGADWREVAPTLFNGGSYGNGAAMRSAPIGGFFQGDPERAAKEAYKAAVITHAHPEGQAGGVAVAAAAAIATTPSPPTGDAFLREVLPFVPEGETAAGIKTATNIPPDHFHEAVEKLGTGALISAQDTVPYCLWCAAYNLHNFEDALWQTIAGRGDCDTICAIVGGIVALSSGNVPAAWIEHREPLPEWLPQTA